MSWTVTAGEDSRLRLCETQERRAILQNVGMILRTAKGTVPGRRDFGVDTDFLDLPLPVAKVRMIGAVREAVETWEPRVRVAGVRFDSGAEAEGTLRPIVEVELADEPE